MVGRPRPRCGHAVFVLPLLARLTGACLDGGGQLGANCLPVPYLHPQRDSANESVLAQSSAGAGVPNAGLGIPSQAPAALDTTSVVSSYAPQAQPSSSTGSQRNTAAAAPASTSQKRGVGVFGDTMVQDLEALGGLAWFYDWWSSPKVARGFGRSGIATEFVPMVWNGDMVSAALGDVAGAQALQTFNEPNVRFQQANMSPEDAARLWPQIQAAAKAGGMRLGAPAAAPCPGDDNSVLCVLRSPFAWWDAFFAACVAAGQACDVDFVATHFYSCKADLLAAYVAAVAQRYGRPVWPTEFSCPLGAAGLRPDDAAATQLLFVRAALGVLDAAPAVERYAWFAPHTGKYTAVLGAGAAMLEPDSFNLTALGRLYVGAPLRPTDEIAPITEALLAPLPDAVPAASWADICSRCIDAASFNAALAATASNTSAHAALVWHCRDCGFRDDWNPVPLL